MKKLPAYPAHLYTIFTKKSRENPDIKNPTATIPPALIYLFPLKMSNKENPFAKAVVSIAENKTTAYIIPNPIPCLLHMVSIGIAPREILL